MSDKEKLDKNYSSDPERTLITLEQLSQTIDVMTSVVDRLRQHLSEQLKSQIKSRRLKDSNETAPVTEAQKEIEDAIVQKKESCVVEIRQQDPPPAPSSLSLAPSPSPPGITPPSHSPQVFLQLSFIQPPVHGFPVSGQSVLPHFTFPSIVPLPPGQQDTHAAGQPL